MDGFPMNLHELEIGGNFSNAEMETFNNNVSRRIVYKSFSAPNCYSATANRLIIINIPADSGS